MARKEDAAKKTMQAKNEERRVVCGDRSKGEKKSCVETVTGGGNLVKLLYTNAQSVVNKMEELRVLASLKQPDIIAITETWTNGDISNEFHLCIG